MDSKSIKIPRMETDEDVHSTSRNGEIRQLSVEQDCPENVETNYFTQKFLHVWPEILDSLRDEKDIVSVLNASPLFSDVWGKRKAAALFPFVIPLLVKTKYMKSQDTLVFRYLNKRTKLFVDDFLTKTHPSWLLTSFSFLNHDTILNFMKHFQKATTSPFISNYCSIIAEDSETFDRAVDMLTEYGDSLQKLELEMSFNENRPSPLMEGLVEVLELVPNIHFFQLELPGYDAEFEDEWYSFRRRPGTSFPQLNSLTELKLQVREIADYENSPPGSFIEPILKAYGNQLTKFNSDGFLLQDFDSQFFSETLSNLISFWIYEDYPEIDHFILAHEKLSHVEWPKLESLGLVGNTLHTKETFDTLNNFRLDLKELRLDSLDDQHFDLNDIDPVDVLPFINLKSLTVSMFEVNSSLWHTFRNQFTNLEVLRFESIDELRYDETPSVPEIKVRKRFFTIFPKLCKLIWVNDKNEYVYKRDTTL
ncbi:unnamed protein product [Orchesella dallaii]|uniref:Uncharacterized protein n=1 Tax=Orchesella dallaii TaxID=48710 RepID=A0ABP1R8I2_9HEXA